MCQERFQFIVIIYLISFNLHKNFCDKNYDYFHFMNEEPNLEEINNSLWTTGREVPWHFENQQNFIMMLPGLIYTKE